MRNRLHATRNQLPMTPLPKREACLHVCHMWHINDLRRLPGSVQETAGFQLFKVHVLHVFQKRSQRTGRHDLEIGKNRYNDLLKWRREEGL